MIKRGRPTKSGQIRLTFSIPMHYAPGGVSLVGNFNNWDPYAHPMKSDNDGYQVSVTVPAHEPIIFRYLGDGGRWFDDSDADYHDEHGGYLNPVMPAAMQKAMPKTAQKAAGSRSAMSKNGMRKTAAKTAMSSARAVADRM